MDKQRVLNLRQWNIALVMLFTGLTLPYSVAAGGTPRAMLDAGVPIVLFVVLFVACGTLLLLSRPRAWGFVLLVSPMLAYTIISLHLMSRGATFPLTAIVLYGGWFVGGLIEAYDRLINDA